MQRWREFMNKYMPDANQADFNTSTDMAPPSS